MNRVLSDYSMCDHHGLGLDVRVLGFESGLRRLNEYRRNRTSESDAVVVR